MKKYIHAWVIQSIEKEEHWFTGNFHPAYSVCRVSFKNPRHTRVGELWNARLFSNKAEAERYFYKRVNHGKQMDGMTVRRRKLFLDEKGKHLAYFENNRR